MKALNEISTFYAILAIVGIMLCFYIADMSQKKNKEIGYWPVFFIGLFLSPIVSYIVVHFTKEKHEEIEYYKQTEAEEYTDIDRIERLHKLKTEGAITESEYEQQKQKILNS